MVHDYNQVSIISLKKEKSETFMFHAIFTSPISSLTVLLLLNHLFLQKSFPKPLL